MLLMSKEFVHRFLHRQRMSWSQAGHCPADASLALEGAYTPALSRMMCRAAAKNSYAEASQDLFEYAEVKVCDRQIQRRVQDVAPAVGPWIKGRQYKPEMALSNFDVPGSKPGKGSSRCRGAARSCLPGSGCAQIACSRICASSSGVRAIGFAFMLLAWEAFSTTSALCSRVMP